eukprot:15787-Heterococcus_DN1.PRE.2
MSDRWCSTSSVGYDSDAVARCLEMVATLLVIESALSQAASGCSAAAGCFFKSEARGAAARLQMLCACAKAPFRADTSPINRVTYQDKLRGKVQGCASCMLPSHSEQNLICDAWRCGFCAAKHEHEDERPCKMLLPKCLLQGLHALQERAESVCKMMTFPFESSHAHHLRVTHLNSSCCRKRPLRSNCR